MIAFILDKRRTLAPGTAEKYARGLELLKRMLSERGKATIPVTALSKALLADFWTWLRREDTGLHGKQRGEDTARKNVEIVQLLWQWLANDDEIGEIPPPKKLEMPRGLPAAAVAPTWDEMDACIGACSIEWHRQLTTVMRFTGLRAAQAMMILWADLDLDRRTLHVTTGKSRQEKQGRIVPISQWFADEIARWGRREGYLIKSGRTGQRERQPRARDIGRAWARAGVRPAAWEGRPDHAFRKGFISGLKRLGAHDEGVKYLTGHSLGLRGRYVDVEALRLEAVVALVPPLMSMQIRSLRRATGEV